MQITTLSQNLQKALTVNSQQTEYAINPVTPSCTSITTPGGEGYGVAGHDNIVAPNRVIVFPFGEGQFGQQFSMRLYYLNYVGDDPTNRVWLTSCLMEVVCTLGDLPGPNISSDPAQNQSRPVRGTDLFCQRLTPVMGSYGQDGDLNTDTGFPSFALVALNGARFVGFDFKRIDDNVTMNALWARV